MIRPPSRWILRPKVITTFRQDETSTTTTATTTTVTQQNFSTNRRPLFRTLAAKIIIERQIPPTGSSSSSSRVTVLLFDSIRKRQWRRRFRRRCHRRIQSPGVNAIKLFRLVNNVSALVELLKQTTLLREGLGSIPARVKNIFPNYIRWMSW